MKHTYLYRSDVPYSLSLVADNHKSIEHHYRAKRMDIAVWLKCRSNNARIVYNWLHVERDRIANDNFHL